jgi:4a-hydroxytetrahydrobiopterin dehydratase
MKEFDEFADREDPMAILLKPDEVEKRLMKSNGWVLEGREIRKEFAFKNFAEALRFVNRVGELAEGMDHHPDIFLHAYKKVALTLTTHDAGGLTRLDFDLAARIENVFDGTPGIL